MIFGWGVLLWDFQNWREINEAEQKTTNNYIILKRIFLKICRLQIVNTTCDNNV